MTTKTSVAPQPIRWTDGVLRILDQRRLPLEEVEIACSDPETVAEAIRTLAVRGAPLIGIAAAYGVALAGRFGPDAARRAVRMLGAARPTAVNLMWAINRMERFLEDRARDGGNLEETLLGEARRIHAEDAASCEKIGLHGAALIADGARILTHCNAGILATGGIGTATAVMYTAHAQGKKIRVFAGETRPLLQGARLTAWELSRAGIDVTLVPDTATGSLFSGREIDAVIVGADRIAANGDTANKVGTSTLAVLVEAHKIPFYVAAPRSTIDPNTPDGSGIPIEERSADEVTTIRGVRIAPEGIRVRNPAFDVTPARRITAILTEAGVLRAPYQESLARALAERA